MIEKRRLLGKIAVSAIGGGIGAVAGALAFLALRLAGYPTNAATYVFWVFCVGFLVIGCFYSRVV